MYCNQCGVEIRENSKFCSNCGCPVPKEKPGGFSTQKQPSFNAVEDLMQKLEEIDNRKKPTPKKGAFVQSTLDRIKKEAATAGLEVEDKFEEKKVEDKKRLILNYPLPTSPNALLAFAQYLYSEISAKKKFPNSLTEAWKEKLKQVYLFAKKNFRTAEEFSEIQNCYKRFKRREARSATCFFLFYLFFPIIAAVALTIVYHQPWLLFAAIIALVWNLFLILYLSGSLDKWILSAKQRGAKQNNIPKAIRVIAWHLLVPIFAALVTLAILCRIIPLIVLFGTLLLADICFLSVCLSD